MKADEGNARFNPVKTFTSRYEDINKQELTNCANMRKSIVNYQE